MVLNEMAVFLEGWRLALARYPRAFRPRQKQLVEEPDMLFVLGIDRD